MILLVDNYDSFVFNLDRYLQRLGQTTEVVRSDRVELSAIEDGKYQAIVISPGPKAPDDAGLSLEIIDRFYRTLPILGVCLGHQAICQALGATIVRAPKAVHGRSSPIHYESSRLFAGLPNPFDAARYHSLVAQLETIPACLKITGTCQEHADGSPLVMAVEHVEAPLFGVQFHPESILSEVGYAILSNFLKLAGLLTAGSLPPSDFATEQVWSRYRQAISGCAPEAPPVVLPKLR